MNRLPDDVIAYIMEFHTHKDYIASMKVHTRKVMQQKFKDGVLNRHTPLEEGSFYYEPNCFMYGVTKIIRLTRCFVTYRHCHQDGRLFNSTGKKNVSRFSDKDTFPMNSLLPYVWYMKQPFDIQDALIRYIEEVLRPNPYFT